ncbi:MAG: ribulose-phosphate 3-epimerase [Pseudonocardiales bacterium]
MSRRLGSARMLTAEERTREVLNMHAYVSLWSADLLDVGRAVDLIADDADGLHVDVFDGHNVDELLFGPDFVAALRRRTALLIDVHLNVTDPDHWARRFIDVGADMVTVQAGPAADIRATLDKIRAAGAQPSLGVETHEPLIDAAALAEHVDRFLLMGTAIGVKGVGLDPRTPERIVQLRTRVRRSGHEKPIFVDGGIRPDTVAMLASAGADGVIPGSLVFGAADPVAAIRHVHSLTFTDASVTDPSSR